MAMLARRGFWNSVPRPCLALAPMYDVTDCAYRRIIAKYGKPHVSYTGMTFILFPTKTEFVSVDGLLQTGNDRAYNKLLKSLKFHPEEKPIVAQVFGNDPQKFHDVIPLLMGLGFDGYLSV